MPDAAAIACVEVASKPWAANNSAAALMMRARVSSPRRRRRSVVAGSTSDGDAGRFHVRTVAHR